MQDFEKLGVFYLGRQFDPASRSLKDELVLYDSKDLVTHAVCVGMTGSGKTGLCLTLLEEAAIDGIPAILVDPKGDLGNLLLTFPRLESADFRPWIDEAEAARQGITPEQLAEATAKKWREGLAEWGQDAARIERFRSSVDLAIYTPGSSAGLPLAVLRAFTVPPRSMLDQPDALRERIASAVSGLLALLGIAADPLNSREHILLAQIFEHAWREGRDLDLAGLVRAIQSPPFDKMGLVDLETFFPAKDRTALAMQINNLLASPGFAGWLEGEPLDIQRLLYTPEGKPRLSIISIAHLSDAERMFFVTILLGEMISWMRSQSGTTSLRAVFYMDEVFGYFPPTANPPTKTPMLTLLKQARAFGLGVVLATQNPVDLDYKGLSNAGTWLLGRLQTERDKLRVLEGLEGASAAAGAQFNRKDMEAILAGLGNRVFLMNNVHEDQPVVFQTRWCLSYLGGPLSRGQIQSLMAPRKQAAAVARGLSMLCS
ncbi:MAG: ATP-binding protein, partial [Planctomycetota bacterium]|nr:ATP-binding protein [Planctomycetota bacterium]